MRRAATLALAASCLAGPASAESFGPPTGSGAFDFALTQEAPGIYVAVRPDVFRVPVEGNVTFIVNDTDVLVVDGGGTSLSAENAIKLLRGVTDKPVRYLVNTHWHGDHNFGNSVWQQAYPGLEVVGHPATRTMMQQEAGERGTLAKNKAESDDVVKEMQHGLNAGVDVDGKTPLSAERRAKIAAFTADLRLYTQEMGRVRISPPTLTVEDELVIHRGDREIHILHPGLGNTDSDMVVWLPKEAVLITGDLLPNPIPYGFGSFPKEWIATLERLAALHPRTLIPGHGDIQHDLGYLHQVQALLGAVLQQVGAVAKRGGSLEEARDALDLGDMAKPFTDTPRKKALFQEWFITPITDMAYREARGRPIIQGES